ncbi:hypothetical protein V8C86DRAFT_1373105 [Haematococcus lacustris]
MPQAPHCLLLTAPCAFTCAGTPPGHCLMSFLLPSPLSCPSSLSCPSCPSCLSAAVVREGCVAASSQQSTSHHNAQPSPADAHLTPGLPPRCNTAHAGWRLACSPKISPETTS